MTADGAAEAYKASLDDPSGFWASEADRYHWQTPFDRNNVYSANFKRSAGPIAARWFEDGATNIAYNCLDRQVEAGLGDKLCFIAERNDEGETSPLQPETYTYAEALEETKKLAAALRARGVKKGDRVALFMPMVPELAIAMLACARIGAVHTVVFGGFSRDSLASRIASAGSLPVSIFVLYGARGAFAGGFSLDRIGQQMPSDSQRIGKGIDAKRMSDNANDFYIFRFCDSAGDHALNPGLRDPSGVGCDAMYHLDNVFRQILQAVVLSLDRIWR